MRRVFNAGARFGWSALAALPGLALAGPSGEQVVAGAASIVRPDAQTTRIDQSSQDAIVNWNQFSVGSDEYVIFNQPGVTAAILNRVVGSDPSAILGQISANGRVFLVNPRGVYFAPGARVDVAALTASALEIGDDDFMAGRYVFTKPDDVPEGATVRNDGTIEAGPDGFVVLAGDYVNNSGVIAGRLGTVVLASGSQVTLQLDDDGLINFAVDAAVLSGLAGVDNVGTIAADGGRVLMTAKVAEGLVATAVNNSGLVHAQRIVEENGEVFLRARGGDITQSGTIDVSGAAGVAGGRVIITGDQDIVVAADSTISAAGGAGADGGSVRVVANSALEFRRDATISVRAGDEGDRGGLIELSGHNQLVLGGDAQLGAGGELVIDPAELYVTAGSSVSSGSYGSVSNVGVDLIEAHLNDGTNVTLFANNKIAVSGTGLALNAVGSGDLALRIGSVSYGGSSGSLTGRYCSVGLCSDGSSVHFVPGFAGEIDLSEMNISIGGDLEIRAGTHAGFIKTANLAASGFALISAGASASTEGHAKIETGQVTAGVDVIIHAGNLNNDPTIVTTGNLVAGRDVRISAHGRSAVVTVNDVTAADDISIDADSGDVTAHKLVTTGLATGETSFAITVRGLATSGSIDVSTDVIAEGLNTTIDFDAKNIHVGGATRTVAGNDALVKLYGNPTIGGVDVDGQIQADAGHSSEVWIRGFDIDLGGGIAINANTGDASLSVPTIGTEVDIVGNVLVKSTAAGAFIEVGGLDVAIAGNVLASAGTEAWLSLWTETSGQDNGSLTLNGNATAIGSSAGLYLYGSAGSVQAAGTLLAQGANSSRIGLGAVADITVTGAITTTGEGDAWVSVSGSANIDIGGQLRASGSSAFIGVDAYESGDVTLRGGATATGSYADIDIDAGAGAVTITGDVTAIAHSENAYDDTDIEIVGGSITINGSVLADGGYSASIQLGDWYASDESLSDIQVSGSVTAKSSLEWASVRIYADDVQVGGSVVADGGSEASIWVNAAGALTVTGDVKAIAQSDYGDAEIRINADAITINGSLLADGGSSASIQLGNSYGYYSDGYTITSSYTEQAYSSSYGSFPAIQVNGSITAQGAGEWVSVRIFADTLNVGGAIVVDAGSDASIEVRALNDIAVHAVTATGSEAWLSFEGRNITIDGAMTATATDSSSEIFVEGTGNVTFAGVTRADLVAGIGGTSVRTSGGGVVEGAELVVLGIDGATGGTIDAKTKAGSAIFGGRGVIDLHIDNTAHTGDAMFSFGSDSVSDRNFSNVALRSGGSLSVDTFNARSLSIDVPGRFIAAGAVTIAGGGSLPIEATDQYLFDSMTEAGLVPPDHGPDLLIRATQGIDFDSTLAFAHLTPYLKLFSNGTTTMPGSVTGASGAEFTVVYAPIDPGLPVLFEATPFSVPSGSVGYNAVNHFASIPGTTIVFGEGTEADGMLLTGPLTIGAGGVIDIGDDNFMLLTDGPVSGLGNVISTGRIVQVGRISYSPLEVPVIDEFAEEVASDEDDDDEAIAELSGEEGSGDDDIVEESNVGQLECSA
ncbi:MAG: filamentous hemagglutinin N-terminal domain-containing protein [Gammaproteobacteria bacterium]|nr:filamentous hemagglutinin N-terminal domain-containing protein [Gammaproteobacteria bacterium]